MTVKLLTEHHLEFLGLKGGSQARLNLQLSKCHIVGNPIHWLISYHFVNVHNASFRIRDNVSKLSLLCVGTRKSNMAVFNFFLDIK